LNKKNGSTSKLVLRSTPDLLKEDGG